MIRIASLALCFGCLLAVTAPAATIVVRQDGTGDATTIGAALVAAAATGDVILIGPGTYSEYLTVQKSVDFASESGAAVTILDGLDSQRIFVVDGDCSVDFRGLTFRHALADEGSALLVWNQAHVVLEDCLIIENRTTGSNAVHVRHPGSALRVRNCQFLRNWSAVHSAALSVSMGASLLVDDSQFIENQASGHGAVNAQSAHVEIQGCLFLRNVGGSIGALTLESSNGFVTGNTFHANSGSWASVGLYDFTLFSRNVVTGDRRGHGLSAIPETVHSCNVYDGNVLGAVTGALGPGELVEDPLYCEASADVFLVCSGSPALRGDGGCGAMGAYGLGCTCGPVATEATSWGGLKSLFR